MKPTDDTRSPTCRPTTDRLQQVLDGAELIAALEADPHVAGCPVCRGRVAAARWLLGLTADRRPVTPPPGLTGRLLRAVSADRRYRFRRRRAAFLIGGGLAAAAAALVAVSVLTPPPPPQAAPVSQVATRPRPELAPPPRPVPEHRSLRLGEELARAGTVLLEAPRPLAGTLARAPTVLESLTGQVPPPAWNLDGEPARAWAELPAVTRAGLEPVADAAQKAFARLLRDVAGLSPKPKS